MNHQGLLWNLHCAATVVLREDLNFKSTVIRSKRSSCLTNARSIFAIFFVIERSALMALVFYSKGMLEKVTMQRTQQFSDFSKSKEPS